jgi:hypothetical protein
VPYTPQGVKGLDDDDDDDDDDEEGVQTSKNNVSNWILATSFLVLSNS